MRKTYAMDLYQERIEWNDSVQVIQMSFYFLLHVHTYLECLAHKKNGMPISIIIIEMA